MKLSLASLILALAATPMSGSHGTRRLVLHVPRATSVVTVDGELSDEAWRSEAARTSAFGDGGGGTGRPYSDARFTVGDGVLYMAFYAADEDVRTADGFRLIFGPQGSPRELWVSALGDRDELPDGVRIARDLDGTANDSADDDEEWVVEMAVPFSVLGIEGNAGQRVAFSAERCDVPHDGVRRCASWGEHGGVLIFD